MSAKRILRMAGVLLAGAGPVLWAQQAPDPNVGKDAPAIKVEQWVTGKSLDPAQLKGKPYVIEFWATWCPPCRRSIPHMSVLSQRVEPFGVPVIGLSREPVGTVKPFAQKLSMAYYVGVDAGTTGLAYKGIPFAAVVDKTGKIVWAGHPMQPEFEAALFQATGDFYPEAAAAIETARKGDLKATYDLLAQMPDERAKAGAKRIVDNLAERVAQAETLAGIDRYNALRNVETLYRGVAGTEGLPAKIEALRADAAVLAEIQKQEAVEQFETQVMALQGEAEKKEAASSHAEAEKFYLAGLLKLYDAFIQKYPDHELTKSLKATLPKIKEQLEAGPEQTPAKASPPPAAK